MIKINPRQPENIHKIIIYLIYTLKVLKNVLKMENNGEKVNYIQINQEMKDKTIEKSENRSSNYTNFLGIFKSHKLILKIKING